MISACRGLPSKREARALRLLPELHQHHKHPVCDVQHVSKVLEWAAGRSKNIVVLCPQQRQELVQDVQKAACDLAATRLTRARDANCVFVCVVGRACVCVWQADTHLQQQSIFWHAADPCWQSSHAVLIQGFVLSSLALVANGGAYSRLVLPGMTSTCRWRHDVDV